MPIFEAFALAAEEGGAALADAALADAGSAALAGAELGAMGAGAAELGAAGSGITQAGLAADVTAGGAGAGASGINEAMVASQQNAAVQAANSGLAQTMPASQQAYMNASTASAAPGITSGVAPLPAPPVASGIPMDLQANTAMGQAGSAGVGPINVQPAGYGNVLDTGGMNAPQPSAWEQGYAKAAQLASDHPYITGYLGLKALGGFSQPQGNLNVKPDPYTGSLSKYRMSPDFKARQANPQDYQYAPRYAGGGIMAAGGGSVEQMSNQNAIGANTGYPGANEHVGAYATPFQAPVSQNVLSGSQDVDVDPYTGEQKFAAGGITGDGNLNLQIPLDLGGGGGSGFGSGANGYQAAGSGNGQSDLQTARSYPQAQAQSPQTGFSGLNNSMPATSGPGMFAGAAGEVAPLAPENIMQGLSALLQGQNQGQGNAYAPAFASGGIASYKEGGNLSSTLDYYTNMMDGHNTRPTAEKGDAGIYRDSDPDTMYLDPMSAAQVRMAKINKRANMQTPSMKRPTPMGQLNLRPQGSAAAASGSSLDPENAAQGGIMQAHGHLGGYATGGQPRLLKGPGDGMSDNIPATIAGKQPARLADGEFVVPADVVSHLGNGSTDAGAKKLHQMMTEVRKARTGNPKQGKQINPNKFTPK